MLSFTGCSFSQSKPSPQSKAIAEVGEVIEDLACEIDDDFLKLCQWFQLPRSDHKNELLRVHNLNAKIYKECYIIHNKFVKRYIEEITK